MSRIISLFLFVLLLGCGAGQVDPNLVNGPDGVKAKKFAPPKDSEITDINSGVAASGKMPPFSNGDRVAFLMDYLASDSLHGREAGSDGIEKAATFIENFFKENNVQPFFATYRDTLTNFDGTAYNVVGYLPGKDPKLKDEYVIIGAHYDHIGILAAENGDSIANGANDNASGTSSVMEFARYFGNIGTNKRSIIFALFSAEEKGLLGSVHLAKKLKSQNLPLYTMLNFEMVGVPLVDKEYKVYVTGYEKSNLAEVSNRYAESNLVGFLPTAKEFNLFKRSDNYPFDQEFGVPSQTYCTFDFTNFDHYHKVGDENSLMDYSHMASLVNLMVPVLEGITNAPDKEIKYY
ncbi:MAG: M28 family peptidase [Sediminicola sp.]